MLLGTICILGAFALALFIRYIMCNIGDGFVAIFEKFGFGKVGSLVFGGIVFVVFIELLKYLIYG